MRWTFRQLGANRFRSTDTVLFHSLVLVAAAAVASVVTTPVAAADHGTRSHASPSDERIAALVEALGDPSYETRVDATRRLCAIGPRATAALKRATKGDAPEVAR